MALWLLSAGALRPGRSRGRRPCGGRVRRHRRGPTAHTRTLAGLAHRTLVREDSRTPFQNRAPSLAVRAEDTAQVVVGDEVGAGVRGHSEAAGAQSRPRTAAFLTPGSARKEPGSQVWGAFGDTVHQNRRKAQRGGGLKTQAGAACSLSRLGFKASREGNGSVSEHDVGRNGRKRTRGLRTDGARLEHDCAALSVARAETPPRGAHRMLGPGVRTPYRPLAGKNGVYCHRGSD